MADGVEPPCLSRPAWLGRQGRTAEGHDRADREEERNGHPAESFGPAGHGDEAQSASWT